MRFTFLLLFFTLTFWACNEKAQVEKHTSVTGFGEAFIKTLQKRNQGTLDSYFMSKSEITSLYDTLTILKPEDSTALSLEKKDLLLRSVETNAKCVSFYKKWANDIHLSIYKLDSIHYDYIIAKSGKDIIIPWPRSKNHTPDLYGNHYAKTTCFLSTKDKSITLDLMPFYNGKYWKLDAVSEYIFYQEKDQ